MQVQQPLYHRRIWVIFEGGPTTSSCQNSIPSCQNFFLPGGAMCSAKLLYQAFLPSCPANGQKWKINGCKTGKSGGKTGKYGRNQPKVAETRQKMTEKVAKWEVLQMIFCQASHFCPAKLQFLSWQAPISVLPRLLFFPYFFRPPKYAYANWWPPSSTISAAGCFKWTRRGWRRLEHGDDELMVLFILMVNIMRPPLTILFWPIQRHGNNMTTEDTATITSDQSASQTTNRQHWAFSPGQAGVAD